MASVIAIRNTIRLGRGFSSADKIFQQQQGFSLFCWAQGVPLLFRLPYILLCNEADCHDLKIVAGMWAIDDDVPLEIVQLIQWLAIEIYWIYWILKVIKKQGCKTLITSLVPVWFDVLRAFQWPLQARFDQYGLEQPTCAVRGFLDGCVVTRLQSLTDPYGWCNPFTSFRVPRTKLGKQQCHVCHPPW